MSACPDVSLLRSFSLNQTLKSPKKGPIVPILGPFEAFDMSTNASAIGDVLFTKTQQRVLGLLYGRPEKSYYLNELVRVAEMGKGTIKRELEKLCLVGLITQTKQGNQNHYQANLSNPIYNELKQIVDKTVGVVAVLEAALESILPYTAFAFVYGSVAKAKEHAASDIDLMLVADDVSYTAVLDVLIEAEQQLGRTINPTLYSTQRFADKIQQKNHFVSRVLEQKTLWLKGEAAFAESFKEMINQG